jgi:6-pyruvoyl-tetrahydropterin synthase related domain
MKNADMKNPDTKSSLRSFAGPATILLAAFIAIVPQLIRGNSCGHDFNVHLVSWLDCLNAWRHGILYPHWASSPNYGAGEPRFVYYPPLTWMLGAALGAILPWNLAAIALTFLILAATGLATRALAREALDDSPATLAGCVSIFSGFTLFTAYERCAFPEFAGGFWLPLIILFVLRDRSPSAPFFRRAFDGSTVPLALALAGAWLSNLPLGVIAGYLLASLALLWAIVNKSWAPLLRAAAATILGLGLAAIYWLPATFERHWVDISQAIDDPGYNFENNWAFARHANPILAMHDIILRQVSWIAVSMIAVALAAILICYFRNSLPKPGKNLWWIPLAAIPVVVLFLLFPISRIVWHTLPEMAFLQYPWRWLEAVEAPMAIFSVAAIWPSNRNFSPSQIPSRNQAPSRSQILVLAACAALFLAATVYAATTFFQVCYPEDTVASSLAAYHSGAGFEGMYEYEPPGADITTIATGLPDACLVSDPEVVFGEPVPGDPEANPVWTPAQKSCLATFTWDDGAQVNPEHRILHAVMPRSGFLVFRLESSPVWSIRVLGRNTTWIGRPDALMVIPVPQGPVIVTFDWETGADSRAGCILTLLSGLLLFALSRCERRVARSRLT